MSAHVARYPTSPSVPIRCTLRRAHILRVSRVSGRRSTLVRGIRACPSTNSTSPCPSSTAPRPTRRPPGPAETVARPFDPDELPIEAHLTDEEREFKATLPARAYAPGGVALGGNGQSETSTSTGLRPRAFSLRAIRPPARPRLTDEAPPRAGVASLDGGVAQSVRAAGLYPAGSRFESWLPYQPRRGASATPASRSRASRWFRRAGAEAALAREGRDPVRDLIVADDRAQR